MNEENKAGQKFMKPSRKKSPTEKFCHAWERILFPGYDIENFRNNDIVAIFPKIGLIFNRIKKSGNTSLTAFFSELSGERPDDAASAKNLSRRPDVFGILTAHEIRNYRSLLVVRNPYARILSAYRQKIASGEKAYFSHIPGFGQDTPEGFAMFLYFLENGGLYVNRHWWPQVDLLFKPSHLFSFVAKLENLEAEMRIFLPTIGIDPVKADGLTRPHTISRHTTGSSTLVQDFYTAEQRKLVAMLYRRDFELFGYKH